MIDEEGMLCRELVGSGKSQRKQVVLLLADVVFKMLHESVTMRHMGVQRTLACAQLRFKQQELMHL